MDLPSDSSHLNARAASLVRELTTSCKEKYGINKASPAVYDTAWVSMVLKTVNGEKSWAFPEAFQYILNQQSQSGAWEAYASEIDGILNTLAALLALQKHGAESQQRGSSLPEDMEGRISRATDSLRLMLQQWKVHETDHIGFEMLVPAHLNMLEQYGIHFDFPGRQYLMKVYMEKLSKFDEHSLSGKKGSTLLHSLEAFIGKIDFDSIRHHTILGSMLASPSSTAAYMMETSSWDDESEAYLRWVISAGAGKGSGGVSGIFPTTVFDLTWVISNLLEGGFATEILQSEYLDIIGGELERFLQIQDGVVGFYFEAPRFIADADDTGRTISTLSLLGRPTSVDRLVAQFEGETYFNTFPGERNSSFSTNCHVLKALLCVPDRVRYTSQISKAAGFLCDSWWNGTADDKWNITPQYPMLGMSQALIELLDCWAKGFLPDLPDTILRDRIPVVLIGVLIQTLKSQNPDGSWGPVASGEQTAYAIMTLASISSLSWFTQFQHQLQTAIDKGRDFIGQVNVASPKPEYLWIGKVTYGMTFVSQSYILAALNMTWPTRRLGSEVDKLVDVSVKKTNELTSFYSELPLFSSTPSWMIQASVIEGYFFLPILKRIRLDIFPRQGMKEDNYFEFIPSSWTSPSRLNGASCSPQILLDLMIYSLLTYQVDEYIEAVIGKYFADSIDKVRRAVDNILAKLQNSCNGLRTSSSSDRTQESHERNGVPTEDGNLINATDQVNFAKTPISLEEVQTTLGNFITRILQSDGVKKASRYDQENLRDELRAFLHAHLTSVEENARLSKEDSSHNYVTPFRSSSGTFYDWVRSTGASHVACKPAFVFLSCLIAQGHLDCFPSAEEKYLAQDLNLHLATMTRMYNDYGSLTRDRLETNLNSINFPEFCDRSENSNTGCDDKAPNQDAFEQELKSKLLRLTEYERDCYKLALSRLNEMLEKRVMKALTSFSNTAELYGQIYVKRDISALK